MGYRFLPCLFNELVDFVEVELAWWHIAWADKEAKAKYKAPFWASGWFRWRTWRCPEAGLDNLKWQMDLVWEEDHCAPGSKNIGKPTPQAINAKEIFDLYHWWKEVYPNRPDPHDASGWSAHCEQRRTESGGLWDWEDRTPAERKKTKKMLDITRKLELQYDREDEQMMIRLIKIRDSLWT